MKLSIIIPTYNEEKTIAEIVRDIQAVSFPIDYEIIIIDDVSVDRTYEKETILKFRNKQRGISNIRIFRNKINMGKGFSIRKGIRRATVEILMIQDADNEYSPKDIPALLEPILKREAEVVYGSRFLNCRHPEEMKFPNWVANNVLTQLTNLFFGLHLSDMETCYKIFRAEVLKGLPLKANRFTFEPEVTALMAKKKIPIQELPISYSGRTAKMGKKIRAKDFFYALLVLLKYRLF